MPLQALKELGQYIGQKIDELKQTIKDKLNLDEANRRLEQMRDEFRDQRQDLKVFIGTFKTEETKAFKAFAQSVSDLVSAIEAKEFQVGDVSVTNQLQEDEDHKEMMRASLADMVAGMQTQAETLKMILDKKPESHQEMHTLLERVISAVSEIKLEQQNVDLSELQEISRVLGLVLSAMEAKNTEAVEKKLDMLTEAVKKLVKIVSTELPVKLNEMQLRELVQSLKSGGGSTMLGGMSQPGEYYAVIGDGTKSVTSAGTAVALAATRPISRVDVTAKINNTGFIVVGGSTVVANQATRRGTPLAQGDTATLFVNDLAKVYIDAENSGDGVTYTFYA